MKIRNYILSLIFILFIKISFSQEIVEPSPIKWYKIEQADSLFNILPKPILIDVYTDWCGWCKHMMKTTFANKGISNYINNNFYPVRFDAEGYDTIRYQGIKYTNPGVGKKPKHDFAKFILNSRFSFPTIVYIDKKRKIYQIPGYMKIREIEPLLVYFTEDLNLTLPYDNWKYLYQHNYYKNYEEELEKEESKKIPDTTGIINWLSVKEATSLSLKNNKPILIYLYTDWCQSCIIEDGMIFRNSVIAKLINENYNVVKFNAAEQKTITFFGQDFIGNGKSNPHQLTYALLKQSFKFPAFVFVNNKRQKINEVHGFLTAFQLERILAYIKGENYKKQKFEDYVKSFKGEIIE